jgi:hypothetical protein
MHILKYTLGIVITGLFLSSCNTDAQKDSSASQDMKNQSHSHHVVVEESSNLAEINFENLEFDFGTITEGEKVAHTYYFTNTGSAPLVLQNVSPSCGCTVPDSWPRDPIAPGESGKIEVTFDSNGKLNTQNRTVSIVANTRPSITYLRIKGTVVPKTPQAMGPVRK